MSYQIEHGISDQVLSAGVTGRGVAGNFNHLWDDLLQIARYEHIEKLLIDLRGFERCPSVLETCQMMESAPDLLVGLKIAVVDVDRHGYYGFHQRAAADRGYRIRFVQAVEAARTWLDGHE